MFNVLIMAVKTDGLWLDEDPGCQCFSGFYRKLFTDCLEKVNVFDILICSTAQRRLCSSMVLFCRHGSGKELCRIIQ